MASNNVSPLIIQVLPSQDTQTLIKMTLLIEKLHY